MIFLPFLFALILLGAMTGYFIVVKWREEDLGDVVLLSLLLALCVFGVHGMVYAGFRGLFWLLPAIDVGVIGGFASYFVLKHFSEAIGAWFQRAYHRQKVIFRAQRIAKTRRRKQDHAAIEASFQKIIAEMKAETQTKHGAEERAQKEAEKQQRLARLQEAEDLLNGL